MKILLSNDDGVHAPGLAILAQELQKENDIFVVAPHQDRSAASKSLTLNVPIRAKTLENGFISVTGTPTDCVHFGLTTLPDPQSPDMVIAGINEGENLGDDVLYSGTVSAATEGRFLGYPAIAVSLLGPRFEHYESAAQVVSLLLQALKSDPLPQDTILNINVPDLPFHELKGLKVCRLGRRHQAEAMIRSEDPRGEAVYWVGPPGLEEDAGPETDFFAVRAGYVAITPLQMDLTRYSVLQSLSSWVKKRSLKKPEFERETE